MQKELIHWKRRWCWERLKAGGEVDDRGWDGWIASLIWHMFEHTLGWELGMDRESRHAVVYGIAKSWTRLNDWTELTQLFFFTIFMDLCSHYHYLILKCFPLFKKEILYPLKKLPISLFSNLNRQKFTTYICAFVFLGHFLFGLWNNVFTCVQVTVVLWCVSILHSFLLLNNIPLYRCITFCLPIHQSVEIWVVYCFAVVVAFMGNSQEYLYTTNYMDRCFYFCWEYT